MNQVQVQVALEILRLAKELGTEYMEQMISNSGKTVLTIDDIHNVTNYDPNPGDVFDNQNN